MGNMSKVRKEMFDERRIGVFNVQIPDDFASGCFKYLLGSKYEGLRCRYCNQSKEKIAMCKDAMPVSVTREEVEIDGTTYKLPIVHFENKRGGLR